MFRFGRHIKTLLKEEVLFVKEERKVRGSLERPTVTEKLVKDINREETQL